MQNLSQMTDVIDPLAAAAKAEPENIGHRVCSVLCTAFYTSFSFTLFIFFPWGTDCTYWMRTGTFCLLWS